MILELIKSRPITNNVTDKIIEYLLSIAAPKVIEWISNNYEHYEPQNIDIF